MCSGGPEAATFRFSVFTGEQDGAAPLAANTDALREAQQHQDDRRCDTNLSIGWQSTNQDGRNTDQNQCPHQDVLTAYPVTETTENDAANRARNVTHRVRGEREQDAGHRVIGREKQLREDDGCGGRVDREVVPLQRGSAQTRHEGLVQIFL